MNDKVKYFTITFVLMMILNMGFHYLLGTPNFGGELNPHLGVVFISGLFFGPYGIMGSVTANLICDIVKGYSFNMALLSEIMSFFIGYLAYKLWYTKNDRNAKTRLTDRKHMVNFFMIVLLCGVLYSLLITKITFLAYPHTIGLYYMIGIRYFVNFVNFSLILGILGMWALRIKDFSYTPQVSSRKYSDKLYDSIEILIGLSCVIIIILDNVLPVDYYLALIESIILSLLIIVYATKPITNLSGLSYVSIPEKIIDRFLALTLIMVLFGVVDIFLPVYDYLFAAILAISENQEFMFLLLIVDTFVTIFLIPSYFIIRYVENKVVKPLVSFSKIESRIKVDEKIELNDLIDVYSNYTSQDDEIGMLSRSHIDLVDQNNNYIENIKQVESEKQRILTELDIAHRIQEAILPTDIIENDKIMITGCSKPAKEVGGDFFDYYSISDDKIALVIGDCSGKGVPAAIFATLTQNSIQQHFVYEQNPSKILYDINNRLCKKNSELMFVTLWLGVYNINTKQLIFSNAGHNRPLIKKDTKYAEQEIESGIVLGVSEDYEFINEEIILDDDLILYTDGITDAKNSDNERYYEDRLLDLLNNRCGENLITSVFDDVEKFSDGKEQFDDMTLIHLKIKK